MSYDEEGKKTIKERLWGSMEENPYYTKDNNGKYVPKSDDEIALVRAQELAERKAGIDKYFSDNIKDHQITRNLFLRDKEEKNNTENTGGRRKRRSHKRKSHKRKSNKRKSNKRKSNKRKSSRCRGSRRR